MKRHRIKFFVISSVVLFAIIFWLASNTQKDTHFGPIFDKDFKFKNVSSKNVYYLGQERMILNSDELDLTNFNRGTRLADLLLSYPFENRDGFNFDPKALGEFSGLGLVSKFGGINGDSIIVEVKNGAIESVQLAEEFASERVNEE